MPWGAGEDQEHPSALQHLCLLLRSVQHSREERSCATWLNVGVEGKASLQGCISLLFLIHQELGRSQFDMVGKQPQPQLI